MSIAMSDPVWTAISKLKPWSLIPNNFEVRIKCDWLDIGRNSVIPCIIDKIKIWNITEPYEEERGFGKNW